MDAEEKPLRGAEGWRGQRANEALRNDIESNSCLHSALCVCEVSC